MNKYMIIGNYGYNSSLNRVVHDRYFMFKNDKKTNNFKNTVMQEKLNNDWNYETSLIWLKNNSPKFIMELHYE